MKLRPASYLPHIVWSSWKREEKTFLFSWYPEMRTQLPNRHLVAKSGSVVRFTPNFRNPASSPGVGI